MSSPAFDLAEPRRHPLVPEYRGLEWVGGDLPTRAARWEHPRHRVLDAEDDASVEATAAGLRSYLEGRPWVAPSRDIVFLTDLHADEAAFWRSLVASGAVAKTGPGRDDFELTPAGHGARFLIGGDLFDKGPANLPLLQGIARLRDAGADLTILAGNHDVRTYLGLLHAETDEAANEHFFTRMGRKGMTLFGEVFETYVAGGDRTTLADDEVRERLFPSARWFEAFPEAAEGIVPPPRIEKELGRIREKMVEIEQALAEMGMSLSDLYAAYRRCRALFTDPAQEFSWLFHSLQVAWRAGSVLFLHAGVDDQSAEWIRTEGIDGVNRRFTQLLTEHPFELYNGPVGNSFRTKYRDLDFPLTGAGRSALRRAGVYAIGHGHRNVHDGQRIVIRQGLLNFECDASIDSGTRRREGVEGLGAAATLFRTDGSVAAISTDHPEARIFDPAHYSGIVTRT